MSDNIMAMMLRTFIEAEKCESTMRWGKAILLMPSPLRKAEPRKA
jgi:hypothetical protein